MGLRVSGISNSLYWSLRLSSHRRPFLLTSSLQLSSGHSGSVLFQRPEDLVSSTQLYVVTYISDCSKLWLTQLAKVSIILFTVYSMYSAKLYYPMRAQLFPTLFSSSFYYSIHITLFADPAKIGPSQHLSDVYGQLIGVYTHCKRMQFVKSPNKARRAFLLITFG